MRGGVRGCEGGEGEGETRERRKRRLREREGKRWRGRQREKEVCVFSNQTEFMRCRVFWDQVLHFLKDHVMSAISLYVLRNLQ